MIATIATLSTLYLTLIYSDSSSFNSNDYEKKNLDSTVQELVDEATTLTESTICNDDMITMVPECSGFFLGSVIALCIIAPYIDYLLMIDYYTLFQQTASYIKHTGLTDFLLSTASQMPAEDTARAAEESVGTIEQPTAAKRELPPKIELHYKNGKIDFSKIFMDQLRKNADSAKRHIIEEFGEILKENDK